MKHPFQTNPAKASAKIKLNTTLMSLAIAIFSILWSLAPERINEKIILQFIMSIPLLYVSSIAYTKIAYRKRTKIWDYMGWFSGNTAIALVLNIIGVLIFYLGFRTMTLAYFGIIWFSLLIYTITNIYCDPDKYAVKIFKFLYFVAVQSSFGIWALYL